MSVRVATSCKSDRDFSVSAKDSSSLLRLWRANVRDSDWRFSFFLRSSVAERKSEMTEKWSVRRGEEHSTVLDREGCSWTSSGRFSLLVVFCILEKW